MPLCSAQTDARFETALVKGRVDGGVATDRGVLRAPLLVDALGWRRVLGAAGVFQPPDAPLSRGLEVHPHDAVDSDELHVWVERDLVRRGYGWSVPAGREVRVGVGSYEPRQHVRDATVELAEREGHEPVRYQGNWFPHRLRPATGDGVFFVGDAAGHCFPLSGEGIRTAFYFGIACGRELRAVVEGRATRDEALERYGAFSARHARPFSRALALQRLVPALPPRVLTAALRLVGRRRVADRAFGWYLDQAHPALRRPTLIRMSLAIPVSGPIVVVHGGAGGGVIRPDLAPALKEGLARAVEAGRSALSAGGNAVDAVVEAVAVLENDEHFNAGRGAVLTADGDIEHDAAVMDGRRRRAGAVAALCGQPNPIRVARALLEEGRHGMLAGEGAMRFAEEQGFARVELDVLLTDHRRKQLAARQAGEEPEPAFGDPQPGIWTLEGDTVGAVVLDLDGHLAAGTSTGGIAGKLQGRVGDSPLVGGGLYANDRVCAVSATGTGERIMEAVAAHEVAAGMRLAGLPIQRAVEDACAVVQGDIGLIAVDARGRVGISCNTPIFQRAVAVGDGPVRTGLAGTESVR